MGKCGVAPAPACQPDPHCSVQDGQCMCCYNGGCEIDQQCKCLSASLALDAEATALPNLTGSLAAAVPNEADPHCSITPNGQCMCCYNGGCDVDMTQAKCGVAPAPACQPDPHCSIQDGQCMCCYNGGSRSISSANAYLRPLHWTPKQQHYQISRDRLQPQCKTKQIRIARSPRTANACAAITVVV